jgi:curved DNA-binding protein CbpA
MSSLRKEENIFNILDVPVDIQADKLRKKCQDLLLKLHPDKNGGVETEDYHKVKLKKMC